jgi:hypothetical protein
MEAADLEHLTVLLEAHPHREERHHRGSADARHARRVTPDQAQPEPPVLLVLAAGDRHGHVRIGFRCARCKAGWPSVSLPVTPSRPRRTRLFAAGRCFHAKVSLIRVACWRPQIVAARCPSTRPSAPCSSSECGVPRPVPLSASLRLARRGWPCPAQRRRCAGQIAAPRRGRHQPHGRGRERDTLRRSALSSRWQPSSLAWLARRSWINGCIALSCPSQWMRAASYVSGLVVAACP